MKVLLHLLLLPVVSAFVGTDPRLRFTGRWLQDGGTAWSTWPSTEVHLRVAAGVDGVSAEVSAPFSGMRVGVNVDGAWHSEVVLPRTILGGPWKGNVTLLPKGQLDSSKGHDITFTKLVEIDGYAAPVHPRGSLGYLHFTLEGVGDAGLLPAGVAPGLRLAFFGDDDTTGLCSNGTQLTMSDVLRVHSDSEVTWAAQIARTLGAEKHVTALTRCGTMFGTEDDWQHKSVLFTGVETPQYWDYSRWIPHANIFMLGKNDFLEIWPYPADAKWIASYVSFIEGVAKKYNSSIPSVHVCGGDTRRGPGTKWSVCGKLQQAVSQLNQQCSCTSHHYAEVTQEHYKTMMDSDSYQGCQYMYNEKAHALLAQDVLPVVRKVLGQQAVLV